MVMDVIDTAAPEAVDTAEVEPLAPPSEETPETVEVESPETEQPETPETESNPLAVLDDVDEESLLDHPKVKDILARQTESARRKAESAANQARAEADAEWVSKRGYVDDLSNILRSGLQEDPDTGQTRLSLDTKALEGFTDRLNTTNVRNLVGAISNLVDKSLGSDFAITPEETARIRDAYAEFTANPREHAGSYLDTLLSLSSRAAVEAAKPALRKEIEKAVRKEYETKAEADKRRSAEATNRSGATATNVNGGAPNNHDLTTVTGIMRAKAAGDISEADALAHLNALK